MVDYYPREELVVCTSHIINWARSGDTSCVSGYGVKCAGTDKTDELMVIIASKNVGWGIALNTQATASEPVSVLLWGLVKLTSGADGTTRNYQQTFGTAGLLGDATVYLVHSGPVGWGLQTITAGNEGLYFFAP